MKVSLLADVVAKDHGEGLEPKGGHEPLSMYAGIARMLSLGRHRVISNSSSAGLHPGNRLHSTPRALFFPRAIALPDP